MRLGARSSARPLISRAFTTDFSFQLSSASADGFTFTIQGVGATALGPSGGGLGYGPDTPGGTPGIANSVAVKFDIYSNAGEGTDSTGLYTDGASPTTPALDMTNSGVSLLSGDVFNVHMTYDGTTLTMTITDATNSSQTSRPVGQSTYRHGRLEYRLRGIHWRYRWTHRNPGNLGLDLCRDRSTNGGDTDIQPGAGHLHLGSSRDALGHDDRSGHSLHDGRKHAYREFTSVHDVDGKHDHHDQGDRGGERIQQQRGSERDLHNHPTHGGDTDVQSGAGHLQLWSIVTLSDTTTGAVIHCTTDGSTPNGEFTSMHNVDSEHDHNDQGDRGGDRIQQQRRRERDLHHSTTGNPKSTTVLALARRAWP